MYDDEMVRASDRQIVPLNLKKYALPLLTKVQPPSIAHILYLQYDHFHFTFLYF